MNNQNQVIPGFQFFQSETYHSHRFYCDANVILKVEFLKINGRFYYGVQEYRLDPQSQSFKPTTGAYLDSQIWHNFLKLAINLTNLTTPYYYFQSMS